MLSIFIYGSCGTRDALALDDAGDFRIADYVARSSVASAFSGRPVRDRWSHRLQSSFQQKQVERDFSKVLPGLLTSTDYDRLVIDFIDERLPLHRFWTGKIVTVSAELGGLDVLHSPFGREIPAQAEERFDLWRRGWDRMMAVLDGCGRRDRIVLNQLYWAFDDPKWSRARVERVNAGLARMYAHCAQTLRPEQMLRYDPELFSMDPAHKWGPAPFHYREPLYRETLKQLGALPPPRRLS